ncbi:TPA: hypothetical protein VDB83_001214 [Burkholderia cenocepacia]|uniref:hypothetical protein n=1 Tax=Burkholderia cenocepacia TaxID=95486 RepID=UPI001BA085F5|nr:hypothetical protein [Burkholderia cenocepacia]MBR8096374.1 hypothetical protein [Burkholderia cenocepacia]HEP6426943.1 hypothetical protein [Burkholderia cenocepacia]
MTTDKSRADALNTTKLPDGSGFAVASLPLPNDHWLYAPRCAEWDGDRDTSADTPHPILTHEHRDAVVAAVRYAIRGATMCGQEMDFDPDALVLNAAYALCGPLGGPVEQHEAAPAEILNEVVIGGKVYVRAGGFKQLPDGRNLRVFIAEGNPDWRERGEPEPPAAAAVGKIETFSGKHGLTWTVDPETLPVGTLIYSGAQPEPLVADERAEWMLVKRKRLDEIKRYAYTKFEESYQGRGLYDESAVHRNANLGEEMLTNIQSELEWIDEDAKDFAAQRAALARVAAQPEQPAADDMVLVKRDLLKRAAQTINFYLEPDSPDGHEEAWKSLCDAARASSPNAAGAEGVKPCETCGGRGEVGGWRAGEGYDAEACPDCATPAQVSAPCDHQWTWADGKCADCGAIVQQTTPTTGMTLADRIAHVGGRVTELGCVEFGSAMAVDALIQHVLRDLAPAQAYHAQCCDTPSFCSSVRRCTAKDAAPAQAAEPVAIPSGYALVPIEPTQAMLDCRWDGLPKGTTFQNCTPRGVYAAMLNAAPPPPAPASAPVGLTDEDIESMANACGLHGVRQAVVKCVRALLEGAKQ